MDWLMRTVGSVIGGSTSTFKANIPAPAGKPMNLSGAEKPTTKLIQNDELTSPNETVVVSTTAATLGQPKLARIQPLRIKTPGDAKDNGESIF